jgi:hypothetical protein
MTQRTPHLTVVAFQVKDPTQVLNSLHTTGGGGSAEAGKERREGGVTTVRVLESSREF